MNIQKRPAFDSLAMHARWALIAHQYIEDARYADTERARDLRNQARLCARHARDELARWRLAQEHQQMRTAA